MTAWKTMAKLGVLVVLVAACSHTLPGELVDARMAYVRAARSPGASLVPGDIVDARNALNAAERAYADDGDSQSTRDLAYIAERRAIAAGANAGTARAYQQKQAALADLEETRRAYAAAEQERTRAALSSERQARIVGEKRREEMLASIRDLSTKRSEKGLVLTISGSVLFATNTSVLLPSAQARLRSVANVLKEGKSSILVVGHTDSTGNPDKNQRLSEQRADAVKKFLVQRGVSDDRIRAMGMGGNEPVASNASPEGRADNRRVEIVVEDQKERELEQRRQGQR
jgi:outer membrane protein OmpA-like peptidoglycan-associated protein